MKIERRAVLRGAGGIAIGLPWLNVMAGAPARAATSRVATAKGAAKTTTRAPKRFVVFFSGNGTIHKNWRPVGTETAFRFDDPASPGDRRILEPLEPFKQKLLVLDGIAAKSRKHGPGANGHDKGMGHMLTAERLLVGPSGIGDFSHLPDGSAGGPSIDQEIARRLKEAGSDTKFSSIELGVRSRLDTKRQLTSRMCYRGPFQVVPPENDPAEAFKNLFLGVDRRRSGELARLRAERRSVMDAVMDDFHALLRRLGAEDRQKLDAHLVGIREIEQALGAPPSRSAACRLPEAPAALDVWENDAYPQVGKLQMDLLVLALACDLTRVVSLQWSTGQSPVRFSWLGHKEGHHGLSHLADDTEEARIQLTQIDRWYAEQFAYLLGRMSAVREGDGTLLDHSVVMWVNEQGNGDKHTETEIPYVLAGSAGGYLRTGRYLKYAEVAHNDLYVSMLHAMGFEDVRTFGMKALCTGPLPGLTA